MNAVEVRVESNALATAANNALAFMPANSSVKVARLVVARGVIEFTATDMYAAGRDYAEQYELVPSADATVLVSREALIGLDSTGRKDKKHVGTLKVIPGDGVIFTPGDDGLPQEAHNDLTGTNRDALEMFNAIDDLLAEEQPFRTAFQPGLLMRFSKVKADKNERVADMAIEDPGAPVLVKIGPTFRGLIMPVDRERHAAALGEEGLW